jgi:hypothetical protein
MTVLFLFILIPANSENDLFFICKVLFILNISFIVIKSSQNTNKNQLHILYEEKHH